MEHRRLGERSERLVRRLHDDVGTAKQRAPWESQHTVVIVVCRRRQELQMRAMSLVDNKRHVLLAAEG